MSRAASIVVVGLALALSLPACKESETTAAPPAPRSATATATAPATAAAPPSSSTAPSAGIAWNLEIDPGLAFTMADRANLKIWIVATNKGPKSEPTMREGLELRVNGKPSMEFAMAFGNGLRTMDWDGLAPGKTVRESRGLGTSLFPAAGDYDLELVLAGARVASLHVHVSP